LSTKVIAITGASSGIGRATAIALAAEGAAVVLLARRADRLDAVVRAIAAAGGRALAVPGDVTVEADSRTLVARAVEAFGRLDVMICNAGIGYHGTLDDTPPAVMRRVVDVNLMGTFYAAAAALEVFRRQGRGHIIAVSSIAGRRGVGGSSVYSATKAAQIGFIEALRAEFVGTDLAASIVYPVATTTEFHSALERDFGRVIEGRGPRQSAEQVARAIVACVMSPKAEVYTLRKAWWLAVLSVVAPARADRFMQRFGRRVVPPDAARAR
jgi:NAD(P)-dependent dehydrogenase (short-subunit alcohol dehydrogenase family)